MKKIVVMFLMALVLFSSACTNGNGKAAMPSSSPGQSEAPTATETPTPDFSGTDFSGSWHVSEIIDSNGLPINEAEMQSLGAGFTLELLPNGTYFVYNSDGKALGQGTYSVSLDKLLLAANGIESAYEIIDADTLRIIQPDTSITIMKRDIVETTEGEDLMPEEDTDEPAESEPAESEPAESNAATPDPNEPATGAETTPPDSTAPATTE